MAIEPSRLLMRENKNIGKEDTKTRKKEIKNGIYRKIYIRKNRKKDERLRVDWITTKIG